MREKSKLVLHLDDRLKERVATLAQERGTSVSQIVEEYLRGLVREGPASADRDDTDEKGNTIPEDPPPRTQQMLDAIGPAQASLSLDSDTEAWIDAANEKHK
jgi:hypothetical protein